MDRPTLQTALTQGLAVLSRWSKLPARGIGLVALGLIGLLYVVLVVSMERPAPATVTTAEPPPTSQPEIELRTRNGDTSNAAETLSAGFLGEYDRLAGQPQTTPTADDGTIETDPGSWAGTLAFSLLIVAGLAYVGIWGVKQSMGRQSSTTQVGSQTLAVQETQSLGPNQKLHLVRLGEEMLLIGATEHHITCLARYGTAGVDDSFQDHLQTARQSTHASTTVPTSPVPLQESLAALRKVQRWQRRGDDV